MTEWSEIACGVGGQCYRVQDGVRVFGDSYSVGLPVRCIVSDCEPVAKSSPDAFLAGVYVSLVFGVLVGVVAFIASRKVAVCKQRIRGMEARIANQRGEIRRLLEAQRVNG